MSISVKTWTNDMSKHTFTSLTQPLPAPWKQDSVWMKCLVSAPNYSHEEILSKRVAWLNCDSRENQEPGQIFLFSGVTEALECIPHPGFTSPFGPQFSCSSYFWLYYGLANPGDKHYVGLSSPCWICRKIIAFLLHYWTYVNITTSICFMVSFRNHFQICHYPQINPII